MANEAPNTAQVGNKEKLFAWLAMARVANLPTVWSCAFVCLTPLFLYVEASGDLNSAVEWSKFPPFYRAVTTLVVTLLAAGSLIYCGGCILGDFVDRHLDRATRPNRPIPSRTVSPASALVAAISFLAGGALVLVLADLTLPWPNGRGRFGPEWLAIIGSIVTKLTSLEIRSFALLIISIISYALLHKRVPLLGLLLMSACRFLLPVFFYDSVQSAMSRYTLEYDRPNIVWYALALATYTAGIVLVARTESSATPFTKFLKLSLLIAVLPVVCVLQENLQAAFTPSFLAASLIFLGWLALAGRDLVQNNKPAFVSKLLAGFCLLDLLVVASFLVDRSEPQLWPLLIPLAFLSLSLLLQKLTPAT